MPDERRLYFIGGHTNAIIANGNGLFVSVKRYFDKALAYLAVDLPQCAQALCLLHRIHGIAHQFT